MSFFDDFYMPAFAELSAEAVQDARTRLESRVRQAWPEADTRPNSVLGDLAITRGAYIIAALEEALRRFRSDLNLQNAANGVIYDCDFVQMLLENYGTQLRGSQYVHGVIRVITDGSETLELPRMLRFQFRDGDELQMQLPLSGGMYLLPPGSTPDMSVNFRFLTDIGSGEYEALLPVYGQLAADVAAGTRAAMNITEDRITDLQAAFDLQAMAGDIPLRIMAQQLLDKVAPPTASHRAGVLSFIAAAFPDCRGASVVLPGDDEAMRSRTGPLGLPVPMADLKIKGPAFVETECYARLDWNATDEKFGGVVQVPDGTVLITGLEAMEAIPVVYDVEDAAEVKIAVQSTNTAFPLATCGYTRYQQVYVSAAMLYEDLVERITPDVDETGPYMTFKLTCLVDPSAPALAEFLEADANTWMGGVDVSGASLIPYEVTDFNVKYVRRSGTALFLDTAKEEILTYLNQVSAPRVWSDSILAEIMLHYGAVRVTEVECTIKPRFALGNRVLPPAADPATETPDEIEAQMRAIDAPVLTSMSQLRAVYADPNPGGGSATMHASGPRNYMLVVSEDNVRFTEVFE